MRVITWSTIAASTLLGVPLGYNRSYHKGPTFAPPLVMKAIWNDSTNSTTEEGDHSISYSIVRVVSDKFRGPINILHIDAHPDLSENFNDNYYSHALPFARIMEGKYANRLVRTLDIGEGLKGVYVSINVDSLDPDFAPGVPHIEFGGLSFRYILNILQNLKGSIICGDVVEFNPLRGVSNRMTALLIAKLVRELAAKMSK
ncbi:hypothetical protein KIW84_076461 [Lathyrus oleraceus]|uniref:Arginase n=1 Tax=Pisum sativum TaxID=3888 RepID=A0A9D4ZZH0_PEA|nr:hypothetical protein KIW84_076461 [Pisum sativum]